MFFNIKYHFNKTLLIIFFILINCQLQDPDKNHGILFLENRSNQLVINKSNQNDVIKLIGQPHSRSITNEDIWIFIERTLSKGKYHKLGRHVLKTNNVLVLTFNKYGLLSKKEFYDKKQMNKVKFVRDTTKGISKKRDFVYSFLSSLRNKMSGGKKSK